MSKTYRKDKRDFYDDYGSDNGSDRKRNNIRFVKKNRIKQKESAFDDEKFENAEQESSYRR